MALDKSPVAKALRHQKRIAKKARLEKKKGRDKAYYLAHKNDPHKQAYVLARKERQLLALCGEYQEDDVS